MIESVHVEGFDALLCEVEKYSGRAVFILFSGSTSDQGVSWCPDCVAAEPVIQEYMKTVTYDLVFIHCGVGDRSFWKDQANVFRTSAKLKLKSVPTLMKWGTQMRLEEEQCLSTDLLAELFEE